MTNKKLIIVVPLRRASVRVPEKIYADIAGASLAQRTMRGVVNYANGKREIIICAAVDDDKSVRHLKETFPGLDVVLTDPALPSGTDRVHAAYTALKKQKNLRDEDIAAVINLQGDMPFFSHDILESARQHFATHAGFEGVWTAGHAFTELKDLSAIQCVKALRSHSGRAVYFSRHAIPFSRVEPQLGSTALCHIGIYAYSPAALRTFCTSPTSTWEQTEMLEQLRALYLDIPFVIDEVPPPSGKSSYRGIDTPEDLAWARGFA
ncbi:MAG TPA: hypothetical protein VM901_00875 [Bdellovibrionota bacterium]|jgi:3-deoxy-manno-octulosonate cytidylyltransferase (CMP-KDO synthetase)|nr:hypothetical protein [Bdellovibrionota bacterium]